MKIYDAIVIGAGALGLASTYFLSKAGLSVLCIDRFKPPHAWSASTGESRLFRRAYFEDSRHIPLLKRAFVLWQEIENKSSSKLLHQNGLLIVSDGDCDTNKKVFHHAHEHDLAVEFLPSAEITRRFFPIKVPISYYASFEAQAGLLRPERVLNAFMQQAQVHGASIIENERVVKFVRDDNLHVVHTDTNSYRSLALVISPGPFINDLVRLPMRFTIRRAVQFWFKCNASYALAENFPCFAFASNDDFIYGFPSLDDEGIKVARYQPSSTIVNPLQTSTQYDESELAPVRNIIRQFLPGVATDCHRHKVCFYNLTNDENFLVDYQRHDDTVVYATGGSGHAFKFAPVIGEIVSRLILKKSPDYPIDLWQFR